MILALALAACTGSTGKDLLLPVPDTSADTSTDTSGDTSTDTSGDTSADTSADTSTDTSGDTSTDTSGDTSGDSADTGQCVPTAWYADGDGDGYGDLAQRTDACDAPTGTVADATDCDDADPSVHPDATETCDGRDQDCAGDEDAQLVTIEGGDTYTSVLEAIMASTAGDRLLLCPGVYPDALVIDHDLALEGVGDAASIVLRATDASVVTVTAGAVSLAGVVIYEGGSSTSPGGGINGAAADSLTVTDCEFLANQASMGGALVGPENGQLLVERSSFRQNTARAGGAVVTYGGAVLDSDLAENTASESGGGILSWPGTSRATVLDLTGTVIGGNTATSSGGGLTGGGVVDIVGGTIRGNISSYGGGVSVSDMVGSFDGTVIAANEAVGDWAVGGGVFVDSDASVTFVGCTIDRNAANGWGGGIYTTDGDVWVSGGAITGNSAGEGGGLAIDGWPVIELAGVDMGAADTDNDPSDIWLGVLGISYSGLEVDTTLVCDDAGCH